MRLCGRPRLSALEMAATLRPRRGCINNLKKRSQIRDNYNIDYIASMGYIAQHLVHEGRRPETILKAERDVASTAAGNRGHEKPGTAASP